MKTSTKAILSSVVVIALCLSAVGGVTYSWFSDSEETTVTVNSAQMDLLVEVGEPSVSSFITTISPAASSGSYTIENLAANAQISIPYKTSYKSTIPLVYRTILVLETADNMKPYDYQNVLVNGKALSTASIINDKTTLVLDGPGSVAANATKENWDSIAPNAYTVMKDDDIVITTTTTYGDTDNHPTEWSSSDFRSFTFTIKTEIYQGDYDGFERIVINSTSSEETTKFTIDSTNSTPTSTSVQASGSATIGSSGSSTTIPYKIELDQNITSGAVASGSDKTELIVTVVETPSTFSVNDIGVDVSLMKYTSENPEGAPVDFNGGTADITVTVPGIIVDPVARYVGVGEQPTLISSSTDTVNNTTTVVFRTTHFSKFVVSERNGGSVDVGTYEDLCKYLGSLKDVTINVTTNLTAPADALNIDMEGGANIKLNLGNNTINLGDKTIVINNGKLTINSGENGTIESSSVPINPSGTSKVILNGGSFKSTNDTNGSFALVTDGHSNTTIKDSKFTGGFAVVFSLGDSMLTIEGGSYSGTHYGIIAEENSTIHIDGTTLNAGDNYGIHTAFGSTSKIIIDSGTFHNTAQVLINVGAFSTSSIEINDGEFTTDNNKLIDVQDGTLTINNGDFRQTATDRFSYIISYSSFNGSKTVINGGTFYMEGGQSNYSDTFGMFYANGSNGNLSNTYLTITNGTFTVKSSEKLTASIFSFGSNDFYASVVTGGSFYILNNDDSASNELCSNYDKLNTLTGGTFNFDPSKASFEGDEKNYVASEYTVQDNGDGTYTIVPGSP